MSIFARIRDWIAPLGYQDASGFHKSVPDNAFDSLADAHGVQFPASLPPLASGCAADRILCPVGGADVSSLPHEVRND